MIAISKIMDLTDGILNYTNYSANNPICALHTFVINYNTIRTFPKHKNLQHKTREQLYLYIDR